jgi:hypothetical protein
MAGLFDRLNQELEDFGKRAKDVLDEGRLQLERFRVQRERDEAARQLGYLVHRRDKGTTVDPLEIDAWLKRIDSANENLDRLDRAIAATRADGVTVTVTETPPTDVPRPADAEVK